MTHYCKCGGRMHNYRTIWHKKSRWGDLHGLSMHRDYGDQEAREAREAKGVTVKKGWWIHQHDFMCDRCYKVASQRVRRAAGVEKVGT